MKFEHDLTELKQARMEIRNENPEFLPTILTEVEEHKRNDNKLLINGLDLKHGNEN